MQYGINFDAMTVAGYLEDAALEGVPSISTLWNISQVAYNVIGVHLFGFDNNGTRHMTNHDSLDDENNRTDAFLDFIYTALQSAKDEIDEYLTQPHDYTVEKEICSTSDSWCTLDNIACWGRIYHAPFKIGGYGSPATNSGEYNLRGAGIDPPLVDPIKTGVGQAAGLPENAIGNITLPDHILHNPDMDQWPDCPQPVPQQGSGTPPANCNQIYREPYIDQGNIHMRTRGTGENSFDWLNEHILGPAWFRILDHEMKEAILNDPDHLCLNLNE